MAIAFGSAALVAALAWAQPAQAGPHAGQHGGGHPGAHAGQRDSGSSRQLQLRAPVAAPAAAAPVTQKAEDILAMIRARQQK